MTSRIVHSRRSWAAWLGIALGAGALILGFGLALGAVAAEPGKKSGKAPPAAIPPDAQKVLDENGLKISSGNLALASEGELAKLHAEVPKLKKTLIAAERELHAVEDELEQINTQISSLKVQHMELSAGLTRAAGTTENNRYVGALEATRGQIELAIEQHKATNKRLAEALGKASDARESYIEHVLAMRAKADEISSQWTDLAADADLGVAVEQINATGRTLKLAPSPGFVAAEKRLAALEQTVLSQAIPMTVEGNTLMVNVTIDGKHRCQMQVDSGANSVTLSYRMAKEMGLEPKPTDPKVIGVLADGSEIEGTRIPHRLDPRGQIHGRERRLHGFFSRRRSMPRPCWA